MAGALVLLTTTLAAAAAAAQPSAQPSRSTLPRDVRKDVFDMNGTALGGIRADSAGRVTVRSSADSVEVPGAVFRALVDEYAAADTLRRSRLAVGRRGDHAVLEVQANALTAALVGGVLALLALLTVLLVRSRRREAAAARRAARMAEQRHEVERAREAERQALGHDLHDGVLQMLYAVRFHLPATDDVATVDGLLVQTAEQVRAVTARLRAPMDETVSLVDALRGLPALYPDVSGAVSADEAALARLSAEGRIALYRVAQEAVSNAVRHGGASHVAMRLGLDGPSGDGASVARIVFGVEDNGAGFDTARPFSEDRPHFGLTGMRERAEALGGTLAVESAPGHGTRLHLHLPATGAPAA